MTAKWTAADVPDQAGRLAIVTGATSGLGYDTAAVLADKGARVVLAVRNLVKGKEAIDRIKTASPTATVELQELDLTSLDSVRKAADELRAAHPRIDLLINNAGVMSRETTKDGFEMQFGTNHLGHFALTGQLLENILPVEGSRVVTVSSVGHRIMARIHFEDPQFERKYNRVEAYGQSKLANLLFTYDLQRRLAAKGAPTVALAAHPGLSNTELMRYLPGPLQNLPDSLWNLVGQSAAMGALPSLRAATDPGAQGGQYYGPGGIGEVKGNPKIVGSSAQSHNEDIQRRLWTMSEELTGVTYPV
jgi:NAD(P)-dependent dehydrogenase (short-subunit alcohol dehydrogenase family)